MKLKTAVLIFCLCAATASAKDTIYRWVDKAGVVHYESRSPEKNPTPAQLPEIQTYTPTIRAPAASAAAPKEAEGASVLKEVRLLSPANNETIRGAEANVVVSAQAIPALPDGASYAFFLDGVRKNGKNWKASSFTMSQVERGEHSVAAAVVDQNDRELRRSVTVTVHVKPPSVR